MTAGRQAATGSDQAARDGEEADSLLAALRSRWALVSLSTLLYWLAAQSLRPLVTLRLDELGTSDGTIGLIVSAYPFLPLLLALPGGRLIDRVGVLRVLAVSLVGMAVVGAGYALATTPAQIAVLQIANGIVELFVWLALQAVITYAAGGASRARHLSLFSLAWGLGLAIGPVVGTAVYERAGFAPLGWIYAGVALMALVGMAAPLTGDADPGKGVRGSFTDARAIAVRPAVLGVLLSSFVALYVNSVRTSFYPLFLERSGLRVSQVGVLLSIAGIASLVVRVPLPWLLARLPAGRVLVWSMWISFVPLALTPWIGPFWALAVAAAVMGAGQGVNPPVTVELMAVATEPDERGLAMGLRVAANRLAQVAQPLVFGALITTVGMAAAFPASGALLAGLAVWTARASQRMPELEGKERDG